MILLLDNQDSFVHNLARYFRRLGLATLVVRSDEVSVLDCQQLSPDAIVISPGPRRPEDAGCSVEVIRQFDPQVPILGVCLGHQAIGVAMGASIIECDPVHGMASLIHHDGQGIFEDCPHPMKIGRYHSLAIDSEKIPEELIVTATTDPDSPHASLIMGVRHRSRPLYGVQFHPESILSDQGHQVIKNFAAMAACWQPKAIL